jgi:hypothetical protein
LDVTYGNALVSRWNTGRASESFALLFNGTSGELYFRYTDGTSLYDTTGGNTTIYHDNTWHHIAVCRTASSWKTLMA